VNPITNNSSSVQAIRLWKIENNSLQEIEKSKLDLEGRLENWIASDISIISKRLLVIGRQVETSYGGFIDILCIDESGDLVIVELKRDKTPREITAQALDYASWVKELTADQVQEIAEKYLKSSLEDAFHFKFGNSLPSSINQEHEMLIVGSEIDSSSQRIINYLSETYGVAINAATFNYFKEDGREYLARTFLIEPSKAEMAQTSRPGKRTRNLTWEQLQAIADESGVGELYKYALDKLTPLFDYIGTTQSTAAFVGNIDGQSRTIFSLVPGESSLEHGVRFRVYLKRFAVYFKISNEQVDLMLPKNRQPWRYQTSASDEYSGYEGFFKDTIEFEEFLRKISANKLGK
jgi:hypothetical protein